jgi:predicted transcriptional regulator
MCMLSDRLQILVSPEQRRRLEEEARRIEISVGALVRQAIDARVGATARDERRRAAAEIASLQGRFLAPDELEALVDAERDAAADPVRPG